MSFVRQSKFRHVFGTAYKTDQTYTELRADISAWDADFIKINSKFLAVPWMGGGGSVAVIPLDKPGKQTTDIPTISGHRGQVLDFAFNPFNDHLIATGSVDCTAKLWAIPEEGLTESITDPLVVFEGHTKKVGNVMFHPTANNVLLTAAVDNKIKLWDVETGEARVEIDESVHGNSIQSLSWNRDGSQLATTCKDKKFRILDPRNASVIAETTGHQGTKGSRVVWMTGVDKLLTVGFSKISARHYMVWDPRELSKPLVDVEIDVASGILMPFYDEDTNILFLAGKGDGNIRYYEVVNEAPYLHSVSEFKTNDPQRGMGMLPKNAVDVMSCEIARLYKLTNTAVTPISFTVPRRADTFQSDLFGETRAAEPALEKDAWFAGENAEPKMMQFKAGDNTESHSRGASFSAQQEKKVHVELPKKTNDPRELLKQNEEMRARIESLEKENAELRAKVEQ